MADEKQTGPWILALGALALGVAALTREVVRRRTTDSDERSNYREDA